MFKDSRSVRRQLADITLKLSGPDGISAISIGMRNIMHAVVVAEDRRFYSHHGVDWLGIARALIRYVAQRKIEGASTIDQQLVRTLRGRFELTLMRKFSECCISIMINRYASKEEILMAYLEVAYFGWRANGIRQVAERLGISLSTATDKEAAAVAAMLKAPMPRAPDERYRARHQRRVRYILKNWDRVPNAR